MWTVLRVFSSPRLFWMYSTAVKNRGSSGPPSSALALGEAYTPYWSENCGQTIISWIRFATELSVYSSPILGYYLISRNNYKLFSSIVTGAAILYFVGLILRAYGRMTNPAYTQFVRVLTKSQQNWSSEARVELSRYDFEFWAWPVEYRVTDDKNRIFLPSVRYEGFSNIPHRLLGWIMINTFGLKLIYPGSTKWLLQALVGPSLAEQRATLVVKHRGRRVKLGTSDGNDIDSMLFDRRSKGGNGDMLVICCEGNAGFYEFGMLTVPLAAGYSVLGWNHPGFWGSSGSPTPSQDAHAADSVMQYALNELGFPIERIVVYGWSIGGYPASWLAMNYPGIRAVILDASFDHLTPLAIPQMPAVLEEVVKISIEENINLDIASQIIKFPGPIRLIRRSKDEIISTKGANNIDTNRGNFLLMKILQNRYPHLTTSSSLSDLHAFLACDEQGQVEALTSQKLSEDEKLALLLSHIQEHGNSYPSTIGKAFSDDVKSEMLLFLASKYKTEFDSGHNTPLPVSLFTLPWEPNVVTKE